LKSSTSWLHLNRVWKRRDAPRCAMRCVGGWVKLRKGKSQGRELHDRDQAHAGRGIEITHLLSFIGPAEFVWAIVQARSLSSASVGRFPRLQYPLSRATSQGLQRKLAANAALPPRLF